MSDLFNEVFGTTDSSRQTPIEIALGIDENGMTTARRLHSFLELDLSNYAKWFKKNILENTFAEANADYWVFVPKDENPLGGRPTQDAKLTANFAKKLSMMQKNEKGEAARNYFVGVENGAKKLVGQRQVPLTKHPGEVANIIKTLSERMDRQDSEPYKSAEMARMVCEQYGIRLPDDFVKVPEYEQMELPLIGG